MGGWGSDSWEIARRLFEAPRPRLTELLLSRGRPHQSCHSGERQSSFPVSLVLFGIFLPIFPVVGGTAALLLNRTRLGYYQQLSQATEVARDPIGPATSFDPTEPAVSKRVQQGGSFLCCEQYCRPYLVGSRGRGGQHIGTTHVGRCVPPSTN
jgi:hypothetical protein